MPIITKISSQESSKDRYNIYIDDKYGFPVSLNVLTKFNLKKGQEITPDQKEEIVNEEIFDKYLKKTLRFINYKIRTKKEIKDRLYKYLYKDIKDEKTKNYLHSRVMDHVESMGLIDDRSYVKAYIEGKKLKGIPPGKFKIRNFLLKKGVSREIIEECLQDYVRETELEGARKQAEKKIKKLDLNTKKDKQKLWNYLYRKGYSSNVIRAVVDSHFKV